jgi:predicted dehydrogenase
MLTRRSFIHLGGLSLLGAVSTRALPKTVSASRPIRVAQLGVAHSHAAGKWATLQRYPETFSCAGIWEPDAALRGRAAAQPAYRNARWLTESELFGDGSIDAALVETELPGLLGLGRRCLEAGWHLHLEKPPGANLKGLVDLQDLAERKHLLLQPGYMFRYHPALTFCFDAIGRGLIGRILSVQGDIGKVIGPEERPWLGENYGGSMMLLGSHLLDLSIGIMGEPERTTTFRRKSLPTPDRFTDQELMVLQYPRGLATIRSFLSESGGEMRRQFVVYGEKGTIEILPLEPAHVRLALNAPAENFRKGYQPVLLPAPPGRYDAMLLDFAGQARGQLPQLAGFDARHDRLVQKILLEGQALSSSTKVHL